MSIWLGFPEESSSSSSGSDNIQTLIDEIQTKDQEVEQLQDQIVVELEKSDKDLKKTEKEEFVSEAELTSDGRASSGSGIEPITVSDDTTWTEILTSYQKAWGMETGPKKDSLEDKVTQIRKIMDKEWKYGNPSTLHGNITVDTQKRIDEAYSGEAKTNIDDTADKILDMHNKMKELEEALDNERTEVEGGTGTANQDILEAVRSMKAIKIQTVTNVTTDDNRWLIEHQIPGRAGIDSEVSASVIQDLGRRPGKL